jgi:hypothetical protein
MPLPFILFFFGEGIHKKKIKENASWKQKENLKRRDPSDLV